ncbi:hypothetical protein BC628DRAFT_1405603 [Trametes gibbosa]|nr:hypothetical protein BC628DRAFT_1405603 [Trametes gibbosa]
MNTNSLSKRFARFIGRQPRKDCLDRLKDDILLDCVMSRLDVVDIIRLRQVSKLYYELTQHAALWKRLLQSSTMHLPPVPPTSRHTPHRMTGLEAERMVCRAYSLHMNWERSSPCCYRQWEFESHHRVLEMTLLPGGRYLIASVSDLKGLKYAIVVYALDAVGSARAIAKTDTATKAYGLRAKYVTIRNQKSIAIAYLRRDYHHKSDKRKAQQGLIQNASNYSTYHDIDPAVEFRHECVAISARLPALEALADLSRDLDAAQFLKEAKQLPPPFENLVCITSGPTHPLTCPDIEEIFDSAYLAVAKHPNDIVFKRLDGGPSATLTCMPVPTYAQSTHVIKAIRLLPAESTVFVVREVAVPRTPSQLHPIYSFEKYSIIPAGPNKISQTRMSEACILAHDVGHLSHIHIADPNVPPRADDSILGKLRGNVDDPPLPPPLSIYGRRVNEEGFVLVRFFAQRFVHEFPPTPPSAGSWRSHLPLRRRVTYHYPLHYNDLFEKDSHLDETVRILPGVIRPLIVYTPWDDITDAPPIVEIRPWIDRGMHLPYTVEAGDVVVPVQGLRRQATFANAPWEGLRATALAWDETIGRLVISRADGDGLIVYEFSHAPRQDNDGRRLPLPLRHIPDPDVFNQPNDNVLSLMEDL